VAPEIKFCGLTRVDDAEAAVEIGARYLGLVFAPSPRRVSAGAAMALVQALGRGPRWVGVFVSPTPSEVRSAVESLGLHAVQAHGLRDRTHAANLRRASAAELWGVAAVSEDGVAGSAGDLAHECDVLLFDTSVAGRSGGTGRTFDWHRSRPAVDGVRASARIALAGGLTADNVAAAVRALSPDIVDVSSGIELSPGIKDHSRMRAFAHAVRVARHP
jgi:phosphoribosylanthranilate isomerase